MNKIQKITAFLLLSVFLAVCTTSCSTARGFGRDVGKAGNAIQRAAR